MEKISIKPRYKSEAERITDELGKCKKYFRFAVVTDTHIKGD